MKITVKIWMVLMIGGIGGCKPQTTTMTKNETILAKEVTINDLSDSFQISDNHQTYNIPKYDKNLFRFLPLKEQIEKSEKYHSYENDTLKRYNLDPTYYSYENKIDGYRIEEQYPGMLAYIYLDNKGKLNKPYSGYKLKFYDKNKKLRNEIDLVNDSPYKKEKYNIVGYGYPDMEDFEWKKWALLSNEAIDFFYKNKIKAKKSYLTVNNINSRPNGFTIVEHQLIEMFEGGIVSNWEETLVVFDSLGNEIHSLTIANDTHDAWTSDDGRYIIFVYGGSRSNNPRDITEGGLKIYDFEKGEYVYEKRNKIEKTNFSAITSAYTYGHLNKIGEYYLIVHANSSFTNIYKIVDFKTNTIYRIELEKDFFSTYKFSTYSQFIIDNVFIKEKL